MPMLVLLRHGESLWNKENRFTGWVDIALSEEGRREAQKAGESLKQENKNFVAFTSLLKRAIETLWICLQEMDQMWIPVVKSWRLNERHYGALQGLNKQETVEKYGSEQVFKWRRGYDVTPPPLEKAPLDLKYKDFENLPPTSESLKDCQRRVLPFWEEHIQKTLLQGQTPLVVAHGNSLRALIQILEKLSDEKITDLNIPTGIPLIYELDSHLKVLGKKYLGDEKEVAERIKSVKKQTEVSKDGKTMA